MAPALARDDQYGPGQGDDRRSGVQFAVELHRASCGVNPRGTKLGRNAAVDTTCGGDVLGAFIVSSGGLVRASASPAFVRTTHLTHPPRHFALQSPPNPV